MKPKSVSTRGGDCAAPKQTDSFRCEGDVVGNGMARLLFKYRRRNQYALYTEELTDDCHDVVCASPGAEALQLVKKQPPDLAI